MVWDPWRIWTTVGSGLGYSLTWVERLPSSRQLAQNQMPLKLGGGVTSRANSCPALSLFIAPGQVSWA